MSFPSRLFSRLNKCISFNFSMLLMLSKSVIAPVAPLWSLSHLSASFLEGGVPPWIKQSSWCLTTYEQPVIDTFYVLYTTWPLIFPRNAFTSLFWKKQNAIIDSHRTCNSLPPPDLPLQCCWLIGLSLWCIWLLAPKRNTKHLTLTACHLTNDVSSTISLPC